MEGVGSCTGKGREATGKGRGQVWGRKVRVGGGGVGLGVGTQVRGGERSGGRSAMGGGRSLRRGWE